MHRTALCAALAAFGLLTTGYAWGGDRDPATAQALFEQGRADAAAGRYAAACPRFEESFRLDPSVGTLLNLADCAEHIGHVAAALAHFTDALAQLGGSDDRLSYVKERILRVKPRVPHLEIDAVSPEPMVILRDAIEVGPASRNIPLPVEPGPHVIVVRSPGRKDREIHVDLVEGGEQRVHAEPGDPLPSAATVPLANVPGGAASVPWPATTTTASPSTGRGAWPWLAGSVGAAGIAAGAVAGILALSDAGSLRQLCANHTCANASDFSKASDIANRGKAETTISTVGFSVGLVGAAVATYLWLRPSSGSEHAATRGEAPLAARGAVTSAWAAPWAGPTGGGLAAGAHFE
jgi:hypothetical protein